MGLGDTKKVSPPSRTDAVGAGMEVYNRELPPSHCILEINEFSVKATGEGETHQSEIFEAGGCKWSLSLYPNGNKKRGGKDHISLYLNIEKTDKFPSGWEVLVNYKLFVFDQINDSYLTIQDVQGAVRRFHERKKQWGFVQLLSLETLKDNSNGYLLDDTCIFGAEVSVLKAATGKSKSSPTAIKLQSDPNNKDKSSSSTPDDQADGNEEFKPSLPSTAEGLVVYKREHPPTHYILKLEHFSLLRGTKHCSDMFEYGGYNWSLTLHPNGNKEEGGEGHISLYLKLEDQNNLPSGWEVFVNYKFFVQDQHKGSSYLTIQDAAELGGSVKRFHENKKEWGIAKLLALDTLKKSSNGYLVNDHCVFGVEIFVLKAPGKCGLLTVGQTEYNYSLNKINFKLECFSTLDKSQYESVNYKAYGGYKWRLRVLPKSKSGNNQGVGVEAVLDGHDKMGSTQVYTRFTVRVLDQLHNKHKENMWYGRGSNYPLGNTMLVTWGELHQPESGFLLNDTLIAQVEFHP